MLTLTSPLDTRMLNRGDEMQNGFLVTTSVSSGGFNELLIDRALVLSELSFRGCMRRLHNINIIICYQNVKWNYRLAAVISNVLNIRGYRKLLLLCR